MDKKAIIIFEDCHREALNDLVRDAEKIFKEKQYIVGKISISDRKPGHVYFEQLKEENPDYIISFAMAGFRWKTLASQVSYNLLYAKQIHVLIGDYDVYETFLQKEYAMNLFFFADHDKWTKEWEQRYAGIPYMRKVPTFFVGKNLSDEEKKSNIKNLHQIINQVISIVEE